MATCVPWDVDLACSNDEWQQYSLATQTRAIDLAWATLAHLTGGMVGACPVVARPCRKGCGDAASGAWVGGTYQPPFTPMLRGGYWFNVKCGCQGNACHCGANELSEVTFPGYVALIGKVYIDGAELDPAAYRLDNGRILVRQDGDVWPTCQDLTKPYDAVGTFSVIYMPGINPGGAGAAAAGSLAVEFAKACSGQKCRLPSSVTSMSRQGVSMEFSQGMFPDGHTGIREVDAYVLGVNPNHLVKPPLVWTPDNANAMRFQTSGLPSLAASPAGPFGPEFGPEFAVITP